MDAYRRDRGMDGSFTFQGTFRAGCHLGVYIHTSYILEACRCRSCPYHHVQVKPMMAFSIER